MTTHPGSRVPGEVLDILRLWHPTPLVRAVRLERALGTPARIYYKDGDHLHVRLPDETEWLRRRLPFAK